MSLSSHAPSPAPSFDEPIDMLEACHGRISVMRYFDTSGVDHHRDEDEDLFPLLRALAAEAGVRPAT